MSEQVPGHGPSDPGWDDDEALSVDEAADQLFDIAKDLVWIAPMYVDTFIRHSPRLDPWPEHLGTPHLTAGLTVDGESLLEVRAPGDVHVRAVGRWTGIEPKLYSVDFTWMGRGLLGGDDRQQVARFTAGIWCRLADAHHIVRHQAASAATQALLERVMTDDPQLDAATLADMPQLLAAAAEGLREERVDALRHDPTRIADDFEAYLAAHAAVASVDHDPPTEIIDEGPHPDDTIIITPPDPDDDGPSFI